MDGEFHLHDYLKRIGYSGTPAADLATLKTLQAAHLAAIPFEAIDPYLRRPVQLDPAAIQAKLVRGNRGGYCFEQNLLFKAALEALGFAITGLAGRVRWMAPPESPLGPKTHMLLKAELPEGSYIVDVGFGACLLDAPLQFATDIEQQTALGTYRLSRSGELFALSAKRQGAWRTMYVFDTQPQLQSDYELGNWFTSTNPSIPLTTRLIAERVVDGRRYRLIDRLVSTERRDGEVAAERTLQNANELDEVLRDTFGITPPVPADEIFRRTGG
ncbi:MAG TPA: arylamine N-acetyltransferase [Bradyrhizobium sp.]|uniref:arylamine N-acetyltransferase family protein n=1 Tax=Bradyrhizobium sp. TaxID=376 RepID=UPI002D7E815F|nr:arylamine N-acetyltransferase [Bradyrhizobium sp.]HET7887279.1 arylamine N-acetyltransferase [Bradyrhizobium sp.]